MWGLRPIPSTTFIQWNSAKPTSRGTAKLKRKKGELTGVFRHLICEGPLAFAHCPYVNPTLAKMHDSHTGRSIKSTDWFFFGQEVNVTWPIDQLNRHIWLTKCPLTFFKKPLEATTLWLQSTVRFQVLVSFDADQKWNTPTFEVNCEVPTYLLAHYSVD